LLQENEQYSSNTLFQLAYLTIPYSQLDGGGSNVNGASWDNDYAPYRKILRHMDSYVAYVEIGHLAVCATARGKQHHLHPPQAAP
jgi:hypothetical protein